VVFALAWSNQAVGNQRSYPMYLFRIHLAVLKKSNALEKMETQIVKAPYLVLIPEEIPWCVDHMKIALGNHASHSLGEVLDVDYYNISENRLKIFERDLYKCKYCGKQLTRFSATLDHIQPVSRGGLNSLDNLVTACLHCNSNRGNRPVMEAVTRGMVEHNPPDLRSAGR
jgi:hypothetical protein